MLLRSLFAVAATACLFASGCGPAKLDVTKTQVIDGQPEILILDPQPKAQKITIEFESDKAEVTVMLVKRADCPTDDDATLVQPAKAIAHKKDKSGTFSGELPENTEGLVITKGGTKTTVKIRVHNQ